MMKYDEIGFGMWKWSGYVRVILARNPFCLRPTLLHAAIAPMLTQSAPVPAPKKKALHSPVLIFQVSPFKFGSALETLRNISQSLKL